MILSPFLWSYPFAWNPHFICNLWLIFSTGMVNCRVSISRKQQIGLERKRFTSGGGVMTYLHPMARVWKCVLKEQLLISKIMYAWLCFLFLVLLWFACQWLDGFLNDSSNCIPFNSIWHKSIADWTSTSIWEECDDCCPWEFTEVHHHVPWQINFTGGDKLVTLGCFHMDHLCIISSFSS